MVVYRDRLHNMYIVPRHRISNGLKQQCIGIGCAGETSRNPFWSQFTSSSGPAYIPHILITVRKSKQNSFNFRVWKKKKKVNFLGLPTFKTRSIFFSQSPAFKQKFDLSLIPVVAEDEIHNLRCSELICSQTLTLNYMTNISIIPWCINHVQV